MKKKILAMLLASTMVMGMTMGVNAEEVEDSIIGNSDDTGSITVLGIKEDVTVTAYPIVVATYDADENFSGYDVYDASYEIENYNSPTIGEMAKIAADPKGGAVVLENIDTNTEDDVYVYSKDGLAVGMYLICVTGSDGTVYNPALASINYVNENGGNNITDGSVEMVTAIKDGYAYIKQSSVPSVEKNIVIEDETAVGNSVNIGDTINYEVEINPIPSYTGNFPTLNVVDTLSDGLTYNAGSLAVAVWDTMGTEDKTDDTLVTDLAEGTGYVLTVTGQEIKVDFVLADDGDGVPDEYTLNNYVGDKVVISYSADLNELAEVNEEANGNDVTLNYSKDSKTDSDDNDKTRDDKTYTYTFELDANVEGQVSTGGIITKYGEEKDPETQKNLPLDGAKFKLYTDEACANLYTNPVFAGEVTSENGGQLHIKGLAEGTYYLKETWAPTGYTINTHVFKIDIIADYYEDGQLKSWQVEVDDEQVADFQISTEGEVASEIGGVEIQNTKLINLPSTGGIGTTIFTVAGCGIMIAAAGFFFATRKKEEE